jgi:hypothetical protein
MQIVAVKALEEHDAAFGGTRLANRLGCLMNAEFSAKGVLD